MSAGTRPARTYRASALENAECRTFVDWSKLVRWQGEPLWNRLVHIPNERGKAGAMTAILVGLGMRPGFPDYLFPCPVFGRREDQGFDEKTMLAAGLFIEAKRIVGGKVSADQTMWRDNLLRWGYHAVICAGADEMIDAARAYFRGDIWVSSGRRGDFCRAHPGDWQDPTNLQRTR